MVLSTFAVKPKPGISEFEIIKAIINALLQLTLNFFNMNYMKTSIRFVISL